MLMEQTAPLLVPMQCTGSGHSGWQMAGTVATPAVNVIGAAIYLITSVKIHWSGVVPFFPQS